MAQSSLSVVGAGAAQLRMLVNEEDETMSDVNKALILGRLGFDPEMRATKAGAPIAQLRVATNEWSGSGAERKERTEWHRITLFGRLAEISRDYLKRGSLVYVEGRIRTSEWIDKDGKKHRTTEIVGDVIRMLDGKGVRRVETQSGVAVPKAKAQTPLGESRDLFEGSPREGLAPRKAA
ncbi:MAG: single-stranded DNA-binding protein [Deltaproteobacteria bacterium]|nr:single-stranded DNA-binding protein [Deltaproteobacteria bacterium]